MNSHLLFIPFYLFLLTFRGKDKRNSANNQVDMTGQQHLLRASFLPALLTSQSMGYGFHCLRSWIFMNKMKAVEEARGGCLMWLTWTSSCVSRDDLHARHWLYHVSSLLASFSWSFNSLFFKCSLYMKPEPQLCFIFIVITSVTWSSVEGVPLKTIITSLQIFLTQTRFKNLKRLLWEWDK